MGFVRPDLMPNGTKWSADGGHSGGQAYKTVGFWVGIMCGIGFIGLFAYYLYLKRHYEQRVAAERPRARATVARVTQNLDEVPTEVRHAAKGECSICLSRRAEFGAAAAARPVVVLPCKHAFHAKCLENWFATSLARLSAADDLTCPLCRQAVPAAPRRRRDGEDAAGDVELRGV